MFGLKGTTDTAPAAFPPYTRPTTLEANFWAGDGALWRFDGTQWRKFYVAGVNFGAATPGYYPSRPPNDAAEYATWLGHAAGLNANVIRVFTLLPPSFYRAYGKHTAAGGPLTLFQQIGFDEPPNRDLFDAAFVERTRTRIRRVIDALHGRGEVPPDPGMAGGLYDQDVSAARRGHHLRARSRAVGRRADQRPQRRRAKPPGPLRPGRRGDTHRGLGRADARLRRAVRNATPTTGSTPWRSRTGRPSTR